MLEPPVKVGERIVVSGWVDIPVWVAECSYVTDEARWKIVLHWSEMGVSTVYDSDEGEVWFRYLELN